MMNVENALAAVSLFNERGMANSGGSYCHVVATEGYVAILCGEFNLCDSEDNRPDCPQCETDGQHVCPDDTVEGIVVHCEDNLRAYIFELSSMIKEPTES